jgi:phosphohistidine phosphatase SixA
MNVYVTFIVLFFISFSPFTHSSLVDTDSTNESSIMKQAPLVVFLVRHAEKVDSAKDPGLSGSGVKRALELANTLQDTNIEYVHSSNYIRTRETATPSAKRFGVEIKIYDPRDLVGVAEKLIAQGGIHLIVGHSNTTPELVKLLGGDAKSAIDDGKEFDRLYIVTVSISGDVTSVLMRYGEPYNTN